MKRNHFGIGRLPAETRSTTMSGQHVYTDRVFIQNTFAECAAGTPELYVIYLFVVIIKLLSCSGPSY